MSAAARSRRAAARAAWRRSASGVVVALAMLGLPSMPARAQAPVAAAAPMAQADPAACATLLRGAAATQAFDGVGVRFTRARVAPLAGGASCVVEGRAANVLPFRLLLPLAHWNGGYTQLLCDADCRVPAATLCDEVAGRGYACLVMLPPDDAIPAEGVTHALAGAARTTLARFYAKPARRSLFLGCGNGGHEALRLAQAHPSDFNGILAGAPVIEPAAQARALDWTREAVRGTRGRAGLDDDELRRLHRGALAACDRGDGLADGLVGDPLRCRFDPGVLACGASAGPASGDCLSNAAIEAARRIYAGPPNPAGDTAFTAGLLPGSELEWSALRAAPRRRDLATSTTGAGSTDLAAFAAAGGKLVLYHGLADARVSPRRSIRWFEDLARERGGLVKAQAMVRFFAVPGMAHCGGGEGASRIDFLAALETWAGMGSVRPPDDVAAFRLADATRRVHPFAPVAYDGAQVVFAGWMLGAPVSLAQVREQSATALSRPVFAYPVPTHYKGRGDPSLWINFYAPADYSLQFDEVAR